jgi:hypothetical protein
VLALDHPGEAIYSGAALCHPEFAVNIFSLKPVTSCRELASHSSFSRHDPACPGHQGEHRAATGGPDKPGHDDDRSGRDEQMRPGHDERVVAGHDGTAVARRRGFIAALLFGLPLALSACHLLDQTDFRPKPPPKPVPPPVPSPETRAALVTIEYTKANPDYHTALAAAVHAVETRRPNSLYDVVAVVADASGAAAGQARAAELMTAIEAEGVIPARIQLGLMLEPGRKIPQVRVYLR